MKTIKQPMTDLERIHKAYTSGMQNCVLNLESTPLVKGWNAAKNEPGLKTDMVIEKHHSE
jgi:hypothetical protein